MGGVVIVTFLFPFINFFKQFVSPTLKNNTNRKNIQESRAFWKKTGRFVPVAVQRVRHTVQSVRDTVLRVRDAEVILGDRRVIRRVIFSQIITLKIKSRYVKFFNEMRRAPVAVEITETPLQAFQALRELRLMS